MSNDYMSDEEAKHNLHFSIRVLEAHLPLITQFASSFLLPFFLLGELRDYPSDQAKQQRDSSLFLSVSPFFY